MKLEKIKIKLKECCLTCDYYYPDGIGLGSFVSCGDNKREISCLHMPICKTYNSDSENTIDRIIRCRDCAQCIQHNGQPFCHIHREYTSYGYFCGSAVRKEDEET